MQPVLTLAGAAAAKTHGKRDFAFETRDSKTARMLWDRPYNIGNEAVSHTDWRLGSVSGRVQEDAHHVVEHEGMRLPHLSDFWNAMVTWHVAAVHQSSCLGKMRKSHIKQEHSSGRAGQACKKHLQNFFMSARVGLPSMVACATMESGCNAPPLMHAESNNAPLDAHLTEHPRLGLTLLCNADGV